jgi:hypothetical protein
MDWDRNGKVSFREFLSSLINWIRIDADEEIPEKGSQTRHKNLSWITVEHEVRLKHLCAKINHPSVLFKAVAPLPCSIVHVLFVVTVNVSYAL